MQVVINVPDKIYEMVMNTGTYGCYHFISTKAIREGVPLPKGHGRLIDADKTALLSDLFCYTKYTGIDEAPYEDATKALEFAPTIIEADKAERGVSE